MNHPQREQHLKKARVWRKTAESHGIIYPKPQPGTVFFTATSFRSGNAIRDKPERIWLKQQSGPATDGNYGETNSPKAVGQIEKTINEDNRY
jgi:hypothetical protein